VDRIDTILQGKGKALTSTKSTYLDHKKRIPLHELPKTCRDAVVVVRALNIPFLWIDSLCIIQDCTADWEYEAARMCSVYENALVTLAALDSPDSDTGLFVTSSSRKTAKLSFASNNSIPSHAYVRRKYRQRGAKPFLHSCDESNVLESRGWTFQELTLAPRILWFTAAELGWQCLAETACECDPEPTMEYVPIKSSAIRSALHKSNIDWKYTWRQLVEEYAQRKLTRQTDRLPALSGLAKAVQRRLQSNDEYLFGLWRSDLDRQLLWSTACKYPSLAPDCSRIELAHGDDYVPSWSWASVTGLLMFWRHHPLKDQDWPFVWKILDFQVCRTGLNLYGPGTGWIGIEGSLIQLEMRERKLTIPGSSYRTEFSPDPTYLEPQSLMGKPVFLLVAISGKFNNISACVGLVLRPHDQGGDLFRRAGLCHIFATPENTDLEWDMWLNGVTSSTKQLRLI
jgi:hypothetical protein